MTPTFLCLLYTGEKNMEYNNRTNDFEKVISSINNYDITYILSGKAFGLTSFMQELGKRLFQYHVFTLNTINGVNVANLLVSEIMHSDERKKFKKWQNKNSAKNLLLYYLLFSGDTLCRSYSCSACRRKRTSSYICRQLFFGN